MGGVQIIKEKKMEAESICIFTKHGSTFTFKKVTITTNNESVISFDYIAMSDGRRKIATFEKRSICGWSYIPS